MPDVIERYPGPGRTVTEAGRGTLAGTRAGRLS